MTRLLTLHEKEQEILSEFARVFLLPHQEIWIYRWDTLAASNLKLPSSLKQLSQLPMRFVPKVIEALMGKNHEKAYERFSHLGWQLANGEEHFDIGIHLIGIQMISILSVLDEFILSVAEKEESDEIRQKQSKINLALAALSKFQHNCRASFAQTYMEVRDAYVNEEKAELESDLERSRIKQQEENFLIKILGETSKYLDFDQLFRVFSKSLREVGHYDRVSIALKTENPNEAELIALSSDESSAVTRGTIIDAETPVVQVIRDRKPMLIHNKAGYTHPIVQALYKEGIRSSILVPMFLDDEVIGTLNVSSKNVGFFKESDIPFFQRLGDALAVVVKNAKEHSRILQQLKDQEHCAKIISHIHSTLDINEIIDIVCMELARCAGADRVFFGETFESKGIGVINHEYLNPDSRVKDLPSSKATYQLDDFKEAVELLRKGEVIAANVEGTVHPSLKRPKDILLALKVKTTCWVPVFIFERYYWGVIGIQHCYETYRWRKEQIEMLKAIAKEVSSAIEKAQIYQKQKEEVTRLKKWHNQD